MELAKWTWKYNWLAKQTIYCIVIHYFFPFHFLVFPVGGGGGFDPRVGEVVDPALLPLPTTSKVADVSRGQPVHSFPGVFPLQSPTKVDDLWMFLRVFAAER